MLQPAPTDGSWSATTKVSIDGTDDYIQAGLVAHVSASAWAKVVVMRRPNGEWTTELGRQNGYQNGPDPARQRAEGHHAADVRAGRPDPRPLLARRRPDVDRDRRRLPARRARRTRASASPRTTAPAPRSARSRPSPSASRRTCRPRRRASSRTRRRPATRCCSTARTSRSTNWTLRRRRALRARRLHDQVRRRVRPAVHEAGLRGAVLAQARVDDARRRQLRRLRRLPRHRGEHGSRPRSRRARRSRSTRRTTRPRPRARSTSSRRRTPPPATRRSSRRVSGTRTRSSCARTASSST